MVTVKTDSTWRLHFEFSGGSNDDGSDFYVEQIPVKVKLVPSGANDPSILGTIYLTVTPQGSTNLPEPGFGN